MDALNPVRNRATVAHPNAELLEKEEAMLVINVARTLLRPQPHRPVRRGTDGEVPLVQGAEGVSITEVVNRAFRAYFEGG
jgi:hypothetical protein